MNISPRIGNALVILGLILANLMLWWVIDWSAILRAVTYQIWKPMI